MKIRFIKWINNLKKTMVSATFEDGIMTINYSNGKIERYKQLRGLWYRYPNMSYVSILSKKWDNLDTIVKQIREHGNPWPCTTLDKIEELDE